MIKNALNYILRKRTRTMLIFLVLTIILAMIYAGFSVISTCEKLTRTISEANENSLTVRSYKTDKFETKKFENLGANLGVRKFYDYEGVAELLSGQVVSGEQMVMREDLLGYLGNAVMMKAVSKIEDDALFRSEIFKVVEGRNSLEKEDEILVHETLARKNQWKLGEKIKFKLIELNTEKEFRIAGIFTGKKPEKFTGMSSDFSENMVFVQYGALKEEFGGKQMVSSLKMMVRDGEKIELLKKEMADSGISSTDFEILENENQFGETLESLTGIKQIILMMVYAVMAAGLIVLCLILVLWVRERVYEIGILLAIGRNKGQIMMQFLMELILVSLPAALVAWGLGRILLMLMIGGILGSESLENLNPSSFTSLSGKDDLGIFGVSYLLLMLIIVLAVTVSTGMILVKKPKEILAKIS